jgi:hypothetical protein
VCVSERVRGHIRTQADMESLISQLPTKGKGMLRPFQAAFMKHEFADTATYT